MKNYIIKVNDSIVINNLPYVLAHEYWTLRLPKDVFEVQKINEDGNIETVKF